MSYLIVVYPNQMQALSAYKALKKEKLPTQQISIVGDGYDSTDKYGLIKPISKAKNSTQYVAYWLISLGFIAGYVLFLLTNTKIIFANHILDSMLGGLLGGTSGLCAAVVFCNKTKLEIEDEDSWLYRDRLNAGKYLIIFQGTEKLVNKAAKILHDFEIQDDKSI